MSSLTKKYIMAVTGLILGLFLVGHLAGNLLIFLGPDWLNAYAKHLHGLGPGVWLARLVLLAAVALHIRMAAVLVRENRQARGGRYAAKRDQETTWAARSMILSGLVVLAFIIYHLMHFTWRVTHPEISHLTDALGRHDVYTMVVMSFQEPAIAISYIAALLLLAMHLGHGLWSMFQSLGLADARTLPLLKRFGIAAGVLFFIGYSAIPLAVLLGWVKAGGGL